MLNEEKIRLMTKLSVYEEREGKNDIRLSNYYRSDYERYQVLKTVLCGTIAFLIVVALVVLYNTEFLIQNALVLDYKNIITYGLTIYGLVMVIYILFTILLSSIRFRKSRKRLGVYFRGLKQVEEICREEEAKTAQQKEPEDTDEEEWED
ncbi:MAG: hypothetical protein IJR36_08600 [Lachnospiraceae bacterium]|nr:hypothetical protein [Lachnospiraceae bacterium]MBQ9593918.1 hypothetical protein [Lachnospiraceae bacterium]